MSDIDPEFESLLDFVRDARAFDYTGYRRPSLMRRFEKRMQILEVDGFAAYRQYLEEHPEEFNQLFNTILINVTGFFRDRESWELLASDVIPQILESKDSEEPIRVWSAGCASGEEPYTVAMLLAEQVGDEEFRDRVKIYATDVDDEALLEAREASYTTKQLEDVPEELQARYFQSWNGEFVVRNDLRRGVIFGRNDLHQDPPISRVDLLISRNTLMYFSPDVQERILANFHFALAPRGYLMVGKAEALQSRQHMFLAYDLKRRIFMKDGDVQFRVSPARATAPRREPHRQPQPPALGDTAFEHAPIAQIVIDQRSDVVVANLAARGLFGLRLKDIGRPLQDLELSYRPVDLRSMIDEARSEHRSVFNRGVSFPSQSGDSRMFDVQVSPLVGSDRSMLVGIGVTFLDVTPHRALQDELEQARRELETAYAELQSTVEELETTNEELQSTNEELETMNDEMRERTDEAVRANAFLRSVLSGVVQSVVVLDRELRVTAWSARTAELWGLREDEVEGQHFLNLDIGLPVAELRTPIKSVLNGLDVEPAVLDGHDRRGHPLRATSTFSPLRGPSDELLGVILVMETEPLE